MDNKKYLEKFNSYNVNIFNQSKNKRSPLISIIVPVYNKSKYLDDCINSLINQTLKDFEIIFINDGSTDNSLNKLISYANLDNRITVISQKNKGAGVARNIGLKLSIAKYVTFLDADDFFELNYLENMYNKSIETDADIIVCGYNIYDNKTKKIISTRSIKDKYQNKLFNTKELADNLFTITDPNAWTKFYKKEIILNNKLEFESLSSANDITFTCLSLSLSSKIYFLNKNLINYRINIKDKISYNRGEKIDNFCKAIEILYLKLQQMNLYYFFEKTFKQRVINSAIYELNNCFNMSYSKSRNFIAKFLNNDEKELFLAKLQPKVSIIISAYNSEKYIDECLLSIKNQTLQNIEIICVDDGSDDNTLPIIKSYAKNDRRFVVLTRRNLGVSYSRNQAIYLSTGEYILFVDSDDYISNNCIELLYTKAVKYKTDLINFAGTCFNDIDNKVIKNDYYTIFYCDKNKHFLNKKEIDELYVKIPTSCCRMFYKKEFIIKNNIFFPINLRYEDNYFIKKSLLFANTMGIENKSLYFRRMHNNQLTHNIEANFNDYIEVMKKIIILLYENNSGHKHIKQFYYSTLNIMKKRLETFNLDIITFNKYKTKINDFEIFSQKYINSIKQEKECHNLFILKKHVYNILQIINDNQLEESFISKYRLFIKKYLDILKTYNIQYFNELQKEIPNLSNFIS